MNSAMNKEDLAVIEKIPGNDKCIDCGKSKPRWASVSYGILMCLECSGVHRSLGSHISFVRSIQMDSWPENHLMAMKHGGNENCSAFLQKYDANSANLKEKYESCAAELYRQVLQARIAGTPEPTKLPERKKEERTTTTRPVKKMEGFGSTPHPSIMEKERKQENKKKAILVGASSAAMALGAVAISFASKKR